MNARAPTQQCTTACGHGTAMAVRLAWHGAHCTVPRCGRGGPAACCCHSQRRSRRRRASCGGGCCQLCASAEPAGHSGGHRAHRDIARPSVVLCCVVPSGSRSVRRSPPTRCRRCSVACYAAEATSGGCDCEPARCRSPPRQDPQHLSLPAPRHQAAHNGTTVRQTTG